MIINEIKKDSIKLATITTLFGLIITTATLVCPYILSRIVDSLYRNIDDSNIYLKVLIVIGVYIFTFLIEMTSMIIINRFAVYYKTKVSMKLYNLMLDMEYQSIVEKQPIYLADRIFNSVEAIYSYFSNVTKSYFISIIKISIALILIALYNWLISLLLALICIIYVFAYYFLNRKLLNDSQVLAQKNSLSFSNILSIINEVDYIKFSNNKQFIVNKIEKSINSINKENMKVTTKASYVTITSTFLGNFLFGICQIILAIMFAKNNITIGQYVMLQILTNLVFPSVDSIVNANLNSRDMKASFGFIQEEMGNNLEKFGSKSVNSIKKIEIDISSYSFKDKTLYSNLKWTINNNDKILLTGESGSGKSTLFKGLLGFYNIRNIFINNDDINELDIVQVRKRIFYMSQSVPIISGSIKENILLGEDEAKIEEIKELYFFKSLLKGRTIDDVIFQGANNISGGEKQKIALARLFLSDPDIILLDECFNALDEECKIQTIKDILIRFNDKILILISHDMKLVNYFNKLCSLEKKNIITRVIL